MSDRQTSRNISPRPGSHLSHQPTQDKWHFSRGRREPASIGLGRIIAILLLIAIAATAILAASQLVPRTQTQSAINWKQTGGPSGGRVNILQIDPKNPSIVYAGTGSGICASRDGGETWQSKWEGQQVTALAIDPVDTYILYAGTYAGVYRSTDSGTTWSQANVGLTRRMVFSLAVDPVNTSNIYAGTDNQVFKSTDGCSTWNRSSAGLSAKTIWSLAVDRVTPTVVYAGTESGVFKSTNGGQQWQSANDGIPEEERVQALAIDPQLSSVLYAATDSGVYRSTDAAATWQPVTEEIGDNTVNALAIDPNNTSTLYAAVGTQGVWQSTDNGDNWKPITRDLNELVFTLAINPVNSRVIYAGTGRGIYYSSTASQGWQPRNEGLIGTNVLLLATAPQSPGQAYASTGLNVYRTTDSGENWLPVNWGLVRPNILALAVDPLSADIVYAGTWYSEVYRSNNGGQSWHLVNGGLARDAPINALLVQHTTETQDKRTPGALYAGTNGAGIFVSTDGGIEWTAVSNGLDDLHVQVLALAPTAEGTLYAGTNTGIYRLDLAGGSAHADSLWQPAQHGLPQDEVRSIVVDQRSPSVIYATTVTGIGEIFCSTDGGNSWTALGKGSLPTNIKIQALALQSPRGKQSILYAGTDGGIFRSTDEGLNWRAINDGFPTRANVLALLVDDSSRLYASIQNSGVYTSIDRGTSSILWPLIVAVSLGVPLLAVTILVGQWILQSSEQVQDQILERNWPLWKEQIRNILQNRNQVGLDALPNVPRKLRLRTLRQYIQELGDENLVLRANPPVLQPANSLQVWDFIRNWNAAQQRLTNAAAFEPVVSHIAEQLCQLLGFSLLDSRSYKNLHSYVIKAPALRLRMPPMFPIVFLQNPGFAEQDMSDLYDLMGIINVPSYLALLVIPDDKASTERQRRPLKTRFKRLKRGIAHDFILMGFDDLYRIFVAKDAERRFIQLLLEQVDLTVVSPYVTSGPVPEDMFFGRDYELKTITRTIKDKNFAIVGGRKIGKTSILTKLYRLFTGSPDYYALYLDCQAVQNYDDFCEATQTMWKLEWSEHRPERFGQLVDHLRQEREDQLIVILLDEVDALFQHDAMNQEHLLKAFRAVAQEGCCRFIFCGGRILAAHLHDSESALFNFCHIIRLGYLNPRDTGRIVLEPIQEMGIGFEDAGQLMQKIVDLSACHPNLVQYICQQLIEKLNARGDRFITLADLDAIASSSQFSEYFVQVMWGNATTLERLITLLMLDKPSITSAQIEVELRAHGVEVLPSVIEQALDGLVLCSILNKKEQEYYFVALAFPSIVTVTQDVEALLQRTIQDLRGEMPKAIQHDPRESE